MAQLRYWPIDEHGEVCGPELVAAGLVVTGHPADYNVTDDACYLTALADEHTLLLRADDVDPGDNAVDFLVARSEQFCPIRRQGSTWPNA